MYLLHHYILSDSCHCVSHVFTEMDLVLSTQKRTFLENFPACPGVDCYIDQFEHLITCMFTLNGREEY